MPTGLFKAPLLRGAVDLSVDKFSKMETRISKDIDNWMCNMYFEIRKLPRYLSGHKEHEVQLQLPGRNITFPQRFAAPPATATANNASSGDSSTADEVEAGVDQVSARARCAWCVVVY